VFRKILGLFHVPHEINKICLVSEHQDTWYTQLLIQMLATVQRRSLVLKPHHSLNPYDIAGDFYFKYIWSYAITLTEYERKGVLQWSTRIFHVCSFKYFSLDHLLRIQSCPK
jgi:hypothetical protein